MVDDGAAVDRDLQAVVCIVVLGGFIVGIELQQTDIKKTLMSHVLFVM